MIKRTRKLNTAVRKTAPVKLEPAHAAVAKPAPAKPEPANLALVKAAPAKPLPLAPSPARVQASQAGHVSLEIVKPEAKSVCVAGSFNQWQPEKAPLVSLGNGRWRGDLSISPGRYEYLFVVDGQWVPDPNARETVENPFGGRNSVLVVSE